MSALDALASWPVDRAAGAVVAEGGARETAGDTAWTTRIASVTKLLVADACLVALEEGTLTLEQPDRMAAIGDQGRDGRAGRAAADDDDVVLRRRCGHESR